MTETNTRDGNESAQMHRAGIFQRDLGNKAAVETRAVLGLRKARAIGAVPPPSRDSFMAPKVRKADAPPVLFQNARGRKVQRL